MASWITTKLLGVRKILSAGTLLPERPAINFVTGAVATDNPATNSTDVVINESTVFADATYLPIPSTIVRRSVAGSADYGGTCHFADVQATGDFSAGGSITSGANNNCGGNLDVFGTCDIGAATTLHASLSVVGSTIVQGEIVAGGSITTTGDLIVAGTAGAQQHTLRLAVPEIRVQQGTPTAVESAWTPGAAVCWTNNLLGGVLYIPLDLPMGATLTGASVKIAPVGHSSLPSVMPTLYMRRWDLASATTVTLGSQVDASANAGNYSAPHSITVSGLSHTVDTSTSRYFMALVAENGPPMTPAVIGCVFQHAIVSWTRVAGSKIGQD